MRRLLPLLSAAVLLAVAPGAHAATETASSGAVKATFSYTKKGDLQYSDLHLTIVRAGVTAFDGPTPPACSDPNCGFWPGGGGATSSVTVVDLDGDGEPEVVVQAYSGGAHCCLFAEIYSYDASAGKYVNLEQNFGGGYKLADLNGDRHPEFKAT
ncbi:MAG: FG-GAP repeat domain-containing protein, partial [Thermoleophilaceae bacterium]